MMKFTLTTQSTASARANVKYNNIGSQKPGRAQPVTAMKSHKKDQLSLPANLGGNSKQA